ncbi:MAG: hypothetical protein J5829_07450 [Lachnospiraceae bacterium]|nr:hypothetical protein [Lachnospiraceae bacterium]
MDEEMRNEMNMEAEGEVPDSEAETASGGIFIDLDKRPRIACERCGALTRKSELNHGLCPHCYGYA